MLYKNRKAMVCSPDSDTDFLYIVTGSLQRDTLASNLFIISLDNMNGFTQKIHALLSTGYWSDGSLINSDKERKKKRFLPRCDCVNIVWINHMKTNKTYGKRTRWELHKNATCCFQQILEATPHKTAAVQPFNSYFKTIQVRWTSHAGHCWRSKDYLLSKVFFMDPCI